MGFPSIFDQVHCVLASRSEQDTIAKLCKPKAGKGKDNHKGQGRHALYIRHHSLLCAGNFTSSKEMNNFPCVSCVALAKAKTAPPQRETERPLKRKSISFTEHQAHFTRQVPCVLTFAQECAHTCTPSRQLSSLPFTTKYIMEAYSKTFGIHQNNTMSQVFF
ncbi:MAG: hypothetical protein CL920_25400 [Deltaproteobacteria bacterium]|nr:hypothetical protein [Deltaproteobacteria bacterium]